MDMNRLEVLENLVDELMKDQPEELVVKKYMRQTGIRYSEDPVERLNLVLKALHFVELTDVKEG